MGQVHGTCWKLLLFISALPTIGVVGVNNIDCKNGACVDTTVICPTNDDIKVECKDPGECVNFELDCRNLPDQWKIEFKCEEKNNAGAPCKNVTLRMRSGQASKFKYECKDLNNCDGITVIGGLDSEIKVSADGALKANSKIQCSGGLSDKCWVDCSGNDCRNLDLTCTSGTCEVVCGDQNKCTPNFGTLSCEPGATCRCIGDANGCANLRINILTTRNPTTTTSSGATTTSSNSPSRKPSRSPVTSVPSNQPTTNPTSQPSSPPSNPSSPPSGLPSRNPTSPPTRFPSRTNYPTRNPSRNPTGNPSQTPSSNPTRNPTKNPSRNPATNNPTRNPTTAPSKPQTTRTTTRTTRTTTSPSKSPFTQKPSASPTKNPSHAKTNIPTISPTSSPIDPNGRSAANTNTPPANNTQTFFLFMAIVFLLLGVWDFFWWYQSKPTERSLLLRIGKGHNPVARGFGWIVVQSFLAVVICAAFGINHPFSNLSSHGIPTLSLCFLFLAQFWITHLLLNLFGGIFDDQLDGNAWVSYSWVTKLGLAFQGTISLGITATVVVFRREGTARFLFMVLTIGSSGFGVIYLGIMARMIDQVRTFEKFAQKTIAPATAKHFRLFWIVFIVTSIIGFGASVYQFPFWDLNSPHAVNRMIFWFAMFGALVCVSYMLHQIDTLLEEDGIATVEMTTPGTLSRLDSQSHISISPQSETVGLAKPESSEQSLEGDTTVKTEPKTVGIRPRSPNHQTQMTVIISRPEERNRGSTVATNMTASSGPELIFPDDDDDVASSAFTFATQYTAETVSEFGQLPKRSEAGDENWEDEWVQTYLESSATDDFDK